MDSCVTFGEVKVVEDEGERRSMKTGEIRKKNPETNERYQNLDSSFTFGDLISPVFDRQCAFMLAARQGCRKGSRILDPVEPRALRHYQPLVGRTRHQPWTPRIVRARTVQSRSQGLPGFPDSSSYERLIIMNLESW